MHSSIDETKINLKLTPPPYKNKKYYDVGTDEKTRDSQTCKSEDSRRDIYGCARNIDEKHKNEEDGVYIYPPYNIYIYI